MSLPSSIRVKISSEGAELISLTPVVSQDMTPEELVRQILGVTGKNRQRIGEVLQRGSVIAGASRLRWSGIPIEQPALDMLLARFPDPDPSRPFDASRCHEVVLRGERKSAPVSREAATKRRWFKRESFWDALMTAVPEPRYHEYSYKESADVYRATLTYEQRSATERAIRLLTFSVSLPLIDAIDFYVPRL